MAVTQICAMIGPMHLTASEAGAILGLSRRQVQRLSHAGGPLVAIRRQPLLLLDSASVERLRDARAVVKGDPCAAHPVCDACNMFGPCTQHHTQEARGA